MRFEKTSDRSRKGPQIITFRLGVEGFGIAVSKVREILRPIDLFPVPGMSADVEGVINLRGEIIPVVKMASLLGVVKNAGELAVHKRRIVILDGPLGSFGFFVDEVFEVTRVQAEEMQPLPDFGHSGGSSGVVTGIVKIAGRMVVCIDPEKLITDDLMAKEPAIGQ